MAGRNKERVDVLLSKGKKHLTKAEIEERRKQEEWAKGFTDKIKPPAYLNAKLKKEFIELSTELLRWELFTNLDVDLLAQYLDTRDQYINVVEHIRSTEPMETDHNDILVVSEDYAHLQRTKDKLIRQCRSLAGELGLSVNARMKFILPKKEEEKKSKFDKFGGNK